MKRVSMMNMERVRRTMHERGLRLGVVGKSGIGEKRGRGEV